MRKYDQNSPQAAARILALTMLADRDVSAAEFAVLDSCDVHHKLGLSRTALHAVIDDFCEDLLLSKQLAWADACPVDSYTLTSVMGEIDDPNLRYELLQLCVKLAQADTRLAQGESIVLRAAAEHWQLQQLVPGSAQTRVY